MCGHPPGTRCPTDTRDPERLTCGAYANEYPCGPDVNPVDGAEATFAHPTGDPMVNRAQAEFPDYQLDRAVARIKAANERLARAGIDDRFTYTLERYTKTITDADGRTFGQPTVRLTLNRPAISYDGWTFAAKLEPTPDGSLIAVSAPGSVGVDGWRPDTYECEHCHTSRDRSSTYVLQHQDGTRKQIGSSCVEAFLGVRPQGLWTLDYDASRDMGELDVQHTPNGDTLYDTRRLIATALACSDGGDRYFSRSKAEAAGTTATVDAATFLMTNEPRDPELAASAARVRVTADRYLADGTVDQVIAAGRAVNDDSDYAKNLSASLSREYVQPRHAAYAASAIGAWTKARAQRSRDQITGARPANPEMLAPMGTRVSKIPAKVVTVEPKSWVSRFGATKGQQVTGTLVTLRTDADHEVTWLTSATPDVQPGAAVLMTATVKDRAYSNGNAQTIVSRANLTRA